MISKDYLKDIEAIPFYREAVIVDYNSIKLGKPGVLTVIELLGMVKWLSDNNIKISLDDAQMLSGCLDYYYGDSIDIYDLVEVKR